MALSVDRFSLLEKEIFELFSTARDVLTVVGTLWVTRKALSTAVCVLSALKTYALPSMMPPVNLVKKYGKWAGSRLKCHAG